jgi:sugar phosphate isomerase/epimerase
MEQGLNRRRFLGAAMGTGAAAATGALAPAALARGGHGHDHDHGNSGRVPRDRRGIQLWTVRRLAPDQAGATRVLRELGRMGYTSVEKFWNYGFTVQQFRAVLRSSGLVCISGHDGPGFPASGNWEPGYRETLAYSRALGQKYTGLAFFGETDTVKYSNEATWHALAQHLNRAGAIAREYGLQFFYHNHNFEFENRFNGRPAYDILLAETDRRLVKFQLDLFWVTEGGGNGVEYLRADPTRFVSYHVKDHVWGDRPDAEDWEDAGPGMLDFPDMFDAGDRTDKHYFIEHDDPQLSHPLDPEAELTTAKVGIRYLDNVRW